VSDYYRWVIQGIFIDVYPPIKFPDALALINEVLNNQSTFWLSLDIKIDMNLQVPHTIIYNAIQKFYNLNRSKEEQNILKSEITRLVNFWAR